MTPKQIVEIMLKKDHFSNWLGIHVEQIERGKCTLSAVVTSQMLNGFHTAHGGITYSLSDSALGFASNSYGQHCVSIETSIHHLRPVNVGDQLICECIEINRGKSLGLYEAKIYNQNKALVSFFKGQVKVLETLWEY